MTVGREWPAGSEGRPGLFGGRGCKGGGKSWGEEDGGKRVAWGKRSKLFNRGSGMKMAMENRSRVLRFCWLVGWVGLGWVGLERESWRLRFFGEKIAKKYWWVSHISNYRLGFNRPAFTPCVHLHMYTYDNLDSCSFYTFRPVSPPFLKYF